MEEVRRLYPAGLEEPLGYACYVRQGPEGDL